MKKSKRFLASLMSALLVFPSLALPFSGTAEGTAPQTPTAYPNADPSEPYYVVGRLQNKGEAATAKSEVQGEEDNLTCTSPQISLNAAEPIDLSAYSADKSDLALILDIKVSRADGRVGKGLLKGTANHFVQLADYSDVTSQKLVLNTLASGKYLGGNYTAGYDNAAGEWVTYIVPWSMAATDQDSDKITRLFWQLYNDSYKTADVTATGLDIEMKDARIVDLTKDGEGYANGLVALMYGQTVEYTPDNGKHNQNTMEVYPWGAPLVNKLTADMDVSKLRLEFETKGDGAGSSNNIKNGKVQLQCHEGDADVNYQVDNWSNEKMPQNGTWYSFKYMLDTMKRDGNASNPAMSDPSKLTKFHVFCYNDNKLGTQGQPDENLLAMMQTIRGARIVDLTVTEPRETLKAAINEYADYLFDENAAAVAYDAKVAEGKALLADRDASPAELTAKTAEINEAKAALTGLMNLQRDLLQFSAQEYTKNRATPNANHYYYDWKSGDGVTSSTGADLTDNGTALGANRSMQMTVTLTKNTAYTGSINVGDLKALLKNVELRVRTNIGGEKRTNSYFGINGEPTVNGDTITYKVEIPFTTEAQNEVNWAIVRDALIMVNTNTALRAEPPEEYTAQQKNEWKNNEDIPVYCTLGDVKIVNKTKAVMLAELQQAATEVLEDESKYTVESLDAFKAAQAAAKAVVEDSTATARAIRAEIAKVAAAKAALEDAEVPVDRSALIKAIADAEAKLADGKTYTADTLAALNEKLTAAKAVPDDADQAAVTKAADELNAAIGALVEVVPDNMVAISTEELTSEIIHDMSVSKTLDTPVSLTDEKYEGRELFITFKLRVNKEDNFPADITMPESEWIKKIVNGSVTFSDVKLTDKFSCGEGVLSAAKVGEYVDVTVPVTDELIAKGEINKFRIALFNDLNNFSQEPDANSKGVSISVKDIYLKIGDIKPIVRWTAMNQTLSVLNEGSAFYFDWASFDGVTDAGVNMAGSAENGANPDYVFQATVKFDKLKDIDAKPVDMIKALMIRLRSGTDNKEANWYQLSAEDFTVNEAGDGFTVSVPLSKIDKANIDWSAVRQLLVRQELKDEYHQLVDGQKPAGRVESENLTMTLSEVKVIERADAPTVDYTALNKAIEDAKAKLADGKTYTADTLAALNEKLAAAEALKTSTDQAAVTAAAEALNAAIAGLIEETQPGVDYTALNTAIEAAKAKLADGKTYTADTLAALNEKLAAAEALKTSTDQAAVTAAAEALNAAIAGLIEETEPPVDPTKVPLITEELTSPVQHYMNVYKAFETPVDLTGYAGRDLTISFKLRVNKDEATFPASITQAPAEWIKNIVNGTMILWGGSATDDSGKVNMADNLGVAYKMNCGEAGNLLEKIVLGEYIEVTMPVPQAVIDKGSLAKLEIFLYNDLHKLTNVESDQNVGVTISVKDAYLNVGEAQGSKSELKTLLDGKKSAAELAGYTAQSVDSYNQLFEDAQVVYDDPDATVAEIVSAIASLKAADSVLVPLADNTVMRWSNSEVTKTDMLYGTMFYFDWTAADGVPGANSADPGVDLSGKAGNGANADYSFTAKVTFNPLEGTTAEQISSMWKVLRFRLRSTTIDGAEKATAFYELTPVDFDGVSSFLVNIPLSMFSEVDIDWKDVKDLIVQCEMNDDYKLTEAGPNPHFTMTLSDVKVVNNGVEPPKVDKTALNDMIADAEEIRADLATAGAEEFETALEAARAIAADATATQADVDEAIADLEAAIEGLVIPWGDLNGKDGVTAEDALLALQAATDKVQLTEDQKYLADVNGDGEVTAADALLLLQYATQKISTFPVQDPAN